MRELELREAWARNRPRFLRSGCLAWRTPRLVARWWPRLASSLAVETILSRSIRFSQTTRASDFLRSIAATFRSNSKTCRQRGSLNAYDLLYGQDGVATAVIDAKKKFRRLRGYKNMSKLVQYLEARDQQLNRAVDEEEMAA